MSNNVVFRWIHFSDIHFQEMLDTFNDTQIRAKLPEYLRRIHPAVDAALFSGDFRYGPKKNLATAESVVSYIHNLVEPLKIDDDHVVLVPGNHDLDRSQSRAFNIDGMRKSYNPDVGTIDLTVLESLAQGFPFYSSVQSSFKNSLKIQDAHPHSIVDLGSCFLLLLNTSLLAGKNDDEHQIILGTKLLSDILENPDLDKKPVIAVGHHGFDMMMNAEKHAVTEYLENKGIRLYLCGHEHRNGITSFGKQGKQVNVGCLKPGIDDVMAGFSVGRLYENGNVIISMYKWDRARKGWGKDSNDETLKHLMPPCKKTGADAFGKEDTTKSIFDKRKLKALLKKEGGLKIINDYLTANRLFCPDTDWDISALKDGSLCSDPWVENRMKERLEQFGICVVKGDAGRGKSILSACVAKDYVEKDYFVLKTNSTWSLSILLEQMAGLLLCVGLHALVILENVHMLELELDVLYDKIRQFQADMKRNGNPSRFLFLLNMRPALNDEGQLRLNSKPELFVDLTSSSNQNRRAKLIAESLADHFKLDYKKLQVNGKPLRLNPQPNLRTLRDFFDYYVDFSRQGNTGVMNVTSTAVITRYFQKYGIQAADNLKKRCLLLLGALGYFDAPVDAAYLEEEERLFFETNFDKGWYSTSGEKYHIGHSSDAQYLCEALCPAGSRGGKQSNAFVREITIAIENYFERIVRKKNLTEEMIVNLRNDFIHPVVLPLRLMPEFKDLYFYFRRVDVAKQIVSRIYPVYCYSAMRVIDGCNDLDERLGIYLECKGVLQENVNNLDVKLLSGFDLLLKNCYHYLDLNQDLFGDVNVLRKYLALHGSEYYCKKKRGLLQKTLPYLSTEHKQVIEEMRRFIVNDDGTTECLPLIHDLRVKSYELLVAFKDEGIDHDAMYEKLREMITIVLKRLKLYPNRESSADISMFCHNVEQMEQDLYDSLVGNEDFRGAVRSRVARSSFEPNDLYLFSRLYGKDSAFTKKMDRAMKTASIQMQQRLGKWYHHILMRVEEVGEGSLAYRIGEILRSPTA